MRHTPLGRIRAGAPVLPRDGSPRGMVPHGVAMGCQRRAPLGRIRVATPVPHGTISHGVAMGCQRHAPPGRTHVAAPVPRGTISHTGRFPTALPWAVNGMPRRGVPMWRRRFHAGRFPTRDDSPRRCHGLSTACPVGASGSGRTEGAFHSLAHGNAVGNPSPKIPSPVRASQAPPLGPKVRLFVHNTMPL